MSKDHSSELTRVVSQAICRTFLAANMTTDEVAARCGLKPGRVVEILADNDDPIYVDEIAKLAGIFNVSITEWFESSGYAARQRGLV